MSETQKTFEQMLLELHQGAEILSSSLFIKIDKNTRSFVYPDTFNNTIGYEGDVHSQRITFAIPNGYYGHELFGCENKKIRWKINEVEGVSDLEEGVFLPNTDEYNDYQGYDWAIPPEVYTKAGTVTIAISFYDLDVAGKIGFSWNTPVDRTLRVGESDRNVGLITQDDQLLPAYVPSLNEILTIDVENRRIVAPVGYNYTFANYGDIGTSCVYFRAPRYIKGMDLLDRDNTNVSIVVSYSGESVPFTIDHDFITNDFAKGSHGDGTVLIKWMVDSGVTSNTLGYVGQITIGITIKNTEKALIWKTSPFKGLTIGQALEGSSELQDIHYGYIVDANQTLDQVNAKTIPGVVVLRKVDDDTSLSSLKDGETVVRYDGGRTGSLGRHEEGKLVDLTVPASNTPSPNKIAQYDESGKLHSEMAEGSDDVVTVEYLETNEYLVLGDTSPYPNPYYVTCFNSNGNLESGEPIEDSEVATKKYVDNTISRSTCYLYNPYFNINQRGIEKLPAAYDGTRSHTHIADRWGIYWDEGKSPFEATFDADDTLVIDNDFTTDVTVDGVTTVQTSYKRVILRQTFDNILLTGLLGKEVTLSAYITYITKTTQSDGTVVETETAPQVYSASGVIDAIEQNKLYFSTAYYNPHGFQLRAYSTTADKVGFDLFISAGCKVKVHWMSLCLGSTVAVPEKLSYIDELTRCQRFYLPISSGRISCAYIGTNFVDFSVPIPLEMHRAKNPTLLDTSKLEMKRWEEDSILTGYTWGASDAYSTHACNLRATKSSHGEKNPITLTIGNGAVVYDCDFL